MIQIKKDILAQIKAHASADLPNEACGYLAGKDGVITRAFPMENIDHSPVHFSFDPQEQFQVMRTARDAGLDILANYHSHPETPSRPSEEDKDLAFDPNILYFIVSLADAAKTTKAFRIVNRQVEEEEVVVI